MQTDAPEERDQNLRARMAHLEDQFEELSRNNRLLRSALGQLPKSSRRQLLAVAGAGVGAGALGAFAAQPASGAAQPSGGEGDVGTTSTPFEGFADGMALVTTDISSATTVTKPVVRYDCSVSGFTITLGTELEGPSGFAQRVVLIDETGNAGSNAVTVDTESGNNIDGGGSITINHDHAVTILWWDGSEWRSTRFIDTVDASVVTASEGAARVFQTSDQTISNSSNTTVKWDSSDGDYTPGSVLTVDTANDKITIDVDGRYYIEAFVTFDTPGDGTRFRLRLDVGGTDVQEANLTAGGNDWETVQASAIVPVTATADVTAEILQQSGGDLDTWGRELQTAMYVAKVG